MKSLQLLIFFLCVSFVIQAQTGKLLEIGGIEVIGNTKTDKEIIKSRSGLKVGEGIKFPSAKVYRAMKSLWAMKLFSDVQVVKQKESDGIVFLEIIVEEKKQLNSYSIHGIKKSEESDLKAMVDKHIKKGEIVSKSKKARLKNTIKDHFQAKGYLDVACAIEESDLKDDDGFDLKIVITKGKKVKIKHIDFPDSRLVSTKALRKKMLHTRAMKIPFGSSKLIANLYEQDKQSLIEHYNSLGYRDARITKDSIYRNENGELHIEIYISEGKQYHLGEIEFSGNSIYPDEFLQEVLDMKQGDIFNTEKINTNIHLNPNGLDISALYMDNGYLFFHVELEETGIVENSINIKLNISEGSQATIGKVIITGNTKTKDHVIRRELRTKPGRLFSRADIIRSQRALFNLGYFDPENMDIKTNVNPNRGTVDIEYVVQETNNTKLEASGGWSGGVGLTGTLGVSFQNFSLRDLMSGNFRGIPSGDGQQLSLRAQTNGTTFQSYNFSFTEPWLGGKKPNALSFGGYYSRLNNGEALLSDEFGSLDILGGSIGLGTRISVLNDYIGSHSSINFRRIRLQNWETNGFVTNEGESITNGHFYDISFKQRFSTSTLNHPIFPTQGLSISFTGELTLPYSLLGGSSVIDEANPSAQFLEYHKWRLDAEWYKPVVGKLVFKASAKMGLIGTYRKGQSASPFGKFILGGDALSNQQAGGFLGYDLISQRGYDIDEFDANTGGVSIFNKFTAELRYPVFNNPNAKAWVLGFAEAGNAWDKVSNYNPFDLKTSAGLGFRIHLPAFGTIGVDYGLGFNRENTTPGAGLFRNYGRVSVILGVEPD